MIDFSFKFETSIDKNSNHVLNSLDLNWSIWIFMLMEFQITHRSKKIQIMLNSLYDLTLVRPEKEMHWVNLIKNFFISFT